MSHDAVLHHGSKVTQEGGKAGATGLPFPSTIGSKVCRTEKKKESKKKIGRLY